VRPKPTLALIFSHLRGALRVETIFFPQLDPKKVFVFKDWSSHGPCISWTKLVTQIILCTVQSNFKKKKKSISMFYFAFILVILFWMFSLLVTSHNTREKEYAWEWVCPTWDFSIKGNRKKGKECRIIL